MSIQRGSVLSEWSLIKTKWVADRVEFNSGLLSALFACNASTPLCRLTNCTIMLLDGHLRFAYEVIPILEAVATANRSLLVVAREVFELARATLRINHQNGTVASAVLTTSGGPQADAILESIALFTRGNILSPRRLLQPEELTLGELGWAAEVIIDRETAAIQCSTMMIRIRRRSNEQKQ